MDVFTAVISELRPNANKGKKSADKGTLAIKLSDVAEAVIHDIGIG